MEFPYHYGSHATVEPSLSFFSRGKSFHTTMVLTQQNHKYAGKKLTAKFPYHYGSHATNGTNLGRWNSAIQFPYHYGSHATFIEIYNPSHSFYRVSIPLWFSRNSEGTHRTASPILFPYHYGSHATAFITKILYRFWVGRINQMGRSRKRHRIYISAIRLDLILDGRSTMW